MNVPFNRAVRELYAQTKAVPHFWQTINHSSDLRKSPRKKGNKRPFTRLPGPLADYAHTVWTDIFRKRSYTSAGFSYACQIDGN